jgi:hypothetical protein
MKIPLRCEYDFENALLFQKLKHLTETPQFSIL